MPKINEALTYGLTIRESANDGSDFTNPDADYRRLFLGEDGQLHVKNSAGAVTDIGSASGSDLVQVASGAGSVVIPGLAGSADVMPASPSADDDEFDQNTSGAPSGWTSFGTPTALDTNTALSHLHIQKSADAASALRGVYKAYTPSFPFTITAKVTGANAMRGSFNAAGLYVVESTPGKLAGIEHLCNTAGVAWPRLGFRRVYWTNSTTPTSETPLYWRDAKDPFYLRIVATNSTTTEYLFSYDGLIWISVQSGYDPGFTIGGIALAISSESASYAMEGFFDWVRFT